MAGVLWAFVDGSEPMPLARWNWMDIVGEGGMTLMSGIWLMQLRASRPGAGDRSTVPGPGLPG